MRQKKIRRIQMILIKRCELICLLVILTVSLLGLMGCSLLSKKPVVIMPEARAEFLVQGQAASQTGYLLSESALAKLLEAAERCKAKP
jgi:hypothetical protein